MIRPPSSPDTAVERHLQQREMDELRGKLAEAEDTLRAIRQGEVDAVVVEGAAGPQVYALLNADRPYRVLVERMQEGALTLTPDGTVLYANERLASFLRLALKDIVGRRFEQFVAAEDRDRFDALLVGSGEAAGKSELALSAADGSAIPVYMSVADLPDENQRIVCAIVTDLRWQKQRLRELAEVNAKLVAAMADRERAEAILRDAQKMEAVGQLTAGIAHDFNNLLMVIGGNLELVQARASDERLKRRIESSQRAIARGAHMTGQLLAFARRQRLRPCAISVNAFLRDIEPLLRRAVGTEIRLTLARGEEAGSCLVDPTELQASMLNLAMNAKDAMPVGGSLTITTAQAEFDGTPSGGARPARAGRYVSITVTDSGHGMPADTRERAFDPFFTTKGVGKGTGLGLSQVHGFAHQSDGHVTIESAVGAGTSVRLFLPWAEASDAAPQKLATVPAPRPAKQPRRVLVVEDDRQVRGFLVELLAALGYAATTAESGPAALILLDSGIAVDVVLSDVLMPGMSGFQLAREIRRRLPHLAVALTSGMPEISVVAEDSMPDLPILRKPYRGDDLALAIEAALDAVAPERPPA